MANIKATQTSETDEWSSPLWLYDLLDREFHFGLDPCSTAENHLAPRFFTKEDDGLAQPWDETSYVNPPFSNIAAWTKKCYTVAAEGLATTVMLVPARTDTRYWWSYSRHGAIRFIPGRLRFRLSPAEIERRMAENVLRVAAGKKPKSLNNSAPFPSAVVIFYKNLFEYQPSVQWWNVTSKNYDQISQLQ